MQDIWQSIVDLPKNIADSFLELLKDLFVPDTDYIKNSFNDFQSEIAMKFNIDTTAFETLFTSEQPVADTYTDYNISGVGNFHLKVFDTKFLIDGVVAFRPFIRGFLVLLMLLFHVKQAIGFLGYDAGVIAGKAVQMSNKGGKEE